MCKTFYTPCNVTLFYILDINKIFNNVNITKNGIAIGARKQGFPFTYKIAKKISNQVPITNNQRLI